MATLTSKLIVALVDQVTAPSRAVAAAINRLTDAQVRNTARLNALRGQMFDAAAVAYGLGRAVAAPVRSAMELESAMADVAKVTDFSGTGLKDFERDLRSLAVNEIPLAVTELANLAANAAQSGVPEVDLTEFTRMTAKAAVAWEVTGGEAGEALAKIRTALNMSNPDLFKYADAINHLSDRTAASAPDMVDFSRRVAAQGEFFGFSATQTLAFGAAMVSAGAESEVAATSFRNMGRALTKGASATKRQRAAYAELGLSAGRIARDMQKDAVGTTLRVIEAIGKLPAHMRAATMSDLFGDEARALAPLLGRIEILREALGYVADETQYAGSVSREFENRSKTTATALQLFRNGLNELGITVGAALLPALNDIMATLGPIISRLAAFAEAHPALTRAIIATTAALVALRVAAIATQFAFFWMKGGVLSAAIAGLRGLSGAGRVAAVALTPVTAGFRALRTAMIGYAAAAAVGGHGAALAAMGSGLLGLLNPMRLVTAAFRVLKVALIGTGIGAVLVGIAAAGTWIYNNWSGISTAFEAFKGAFSRAIEPIMPAIKPVLDGFSWLYDSVAGLLGPVDELGGGWAAAGIAAGKFVGETIVALVELPGKVAAYVGQVVDSVTALASDMLAAGTAIAQSLWDGIKAKVDELVAWFAGLPARIIAAIGSIDISSLIKWPTPPSWWTNRPKWAGGTGGESPAVAGARAAGGPVRAGMPYLVGERGPELVTFPQAGMVHDALKTARILRNAAMASAVSLPAAAAPALPSFAPQGGAPAQAQARNAPSMTIASGAFQFTIQGAPGQSPQALAQEVKRVLSAELNALSRGSYSDGAD